MSTPTFADVLPTLEKLYPLGLAESWDNVGLIVPPAGGVEGRCRTVLLTIDLTEQVLAEACSVHADLVVAYHPPTLAGVRRFDPARGVDRTLLRAIRANIAVYSPHTAVDAAPGGVNDWLADALGAGTRRPIVPARASVGDAAAMPAAGQGRWVQLAEATLLSTLVERIKRHLDLPLVRVATSPRHRRGDPVQTVGICAGAGGKLFEELPSVDLLWTGEMRHHDVLARVASGTSVVLCDHTPTERGYLGRLGARLAGSVPGLDVIVSEVDREPLVLT